MMTFRRLYLRKPYSGDFSSYCAMLLRISTMPPLPRPNSSTSSRLAYLSRNLFRTHGQHSYPRISARSTTGSYHSRDAPSDYVAQRESKATTIEG
jgi:hypothetical protein